MPHAVARALLFLGFSAVLGCSSSNGPSDADAARSPGDGATSETGTLDATTADASDGSTTVDASDVPPATDGSATDLPIGEWTDAPGACPAGTTQVDLRTTGDLSDASRGQGAFASNGPGTCYFIHNGTYAQNGSVLFWFQHGGTAAQPIYFIGESRTGVVIHARGTIDTDIGYLTIQNMTFDLTGYSNSGNAFDTIDMGNSHNVTISHVTFTGDCTVGHLGGHIETNGSTQALIEACIIENYGECGPNGHMDHGVYLASGSDITLRNNVIRGNASRGIQFYTASGAYGTLSRITVEQNRIYLNGHEPQEDGIVINGDATGTIDHVTIQHNLIYDNYYSGIRFVSLATSAIVVAYNTLYDNGVRAGTSGNASEFNLDALGSGAGDMLSQNLVAGTTPLINDGCYDATPRGFSIAGNFVQLAPAPLPACVSAVTTGDPMFTNAASGDFHTANPAAAAFGAYGH